MQYEVTGDNNVIVSCELGASIDRGFIPKAVSQGQSISLLEREENILSYP